MKAWKVSGWLVASKGSHAARGRFINWIVLAPTKKAALAVVANQAKPCGDALVVTELPGAVVSGPTIG